MQKILSSKSDDTADAVMVLSRNEVDDIFEQDQSALAKDVPGYNSNMSPNEFGTAVLSTSKLSTHDQQMLILGYSWYLSLSNL
ncbi:hypothetical protein P3T76_009766 [Phytophthora citrophthora]|uniref:Uncharacterized protein n=1 Tax=Phytophthora citrophthora TaxID=4793 RepID=A0AAD9GER2_9STRA|nr:hypothetical protein P3T76_009766 [Phytophthora citrophthora]